MLNSTEHEISTAQKTMNKIQKNKDFFTCLTHSTGAFILLINLKMITIVEGKFLWYKNHCSFTIITAYSDYVKVLVTHAQNLLNSQQVFPYLLLFYNYLLAMLH